MVLRFWYFNDPSRPFHHHSLTIPKPLLLHFCQPLLCSYPRPHHHMEVLYHWIFFFPLTTTFSSTSPIFQPFWNGCSFNLTLGTSPCSLQQAHSSLLSPSVHLGPGISSRPDLVLENVYLGRRTALIDQNNNLLTLTRIIPLISFVN